MKPSMLFALVALGALLPTRDARAWDPFTRQNAHVEEGNRLFARGDARGALREYDLAAREHPGAPEVQLDRGIALLRLGDHARAREALLRATEPPASAEIRAAAYHDLGLSFYQEADGAAATERDRAQSLFREAADACRRALRIKPGVRDTAWNLELAMRRIREIEEEERREEEEREQEEQEQQDQQDQQQQDQQQQDQQQQDQQQRDQQENGQPREQEAQREEREAREEERAAAEPADAAEGAPEHLRRLLDAIEDSEESLERERARVRAIREGRRPAQDW